MKRTTYFSDDSDDDKSHAHKSDIKILLLGDKKVGKSAFIEKLTKKYFTLYYKPTKNIEIHRKIRVADMNICFWDVPSHIKYHFKLGTLHADVVLLMFDTMRPFTKEAVMKQWEAIHPQLEKLPYVFIVGIRTPRTVDTGTIYIDNMTGEGLGLLMYKIQEVCQT